MYPNPLVPYVGLGLTKVIVCSSPICFCSFSSNSRAWVNSRRCIFNVS